MYREADIKSAVLDALFENGNIDADTVVVSEMPLEHWSRRADLVVANGKLIAFEIKSEADTTKRLVQQVETYWRSVEGVTAVVTASHAHEALTTLPNYAGVYVIEPCDGGLKLELARRPHIRPMTLSAALRIMNTEDLRRCIRASGGAALLHASSSRHQLETVAAALPLHELRAAAIRAVKARYRAPFEVFLRARNSGQSTRDSLSHLKRSAWKRPPLQVEPPSVPIDATPLPPMEVIPRLMR